MSPLLLEVEFGEGVGQPWLDFKGAWIWQWRGEAGGKRGLGMVPSREILLGVRPEHIVLAKSAEGAIPVTLEVNEMMGSELHLHVYTDDGTRLIVRVPTIDLTAAERENLVQGHQLYITFEGKVMHFFDPETEKNLIY